MRMMTEALITAMLMDCTGQSPQDKPDEFLSEDEVIASLPSWKSQITLRALAVGFIMGAVFSFITMRFSLGPGGIVPTFNMPIGAVPQIARQEFNKFRNLQYQPMHFQ